MKNKNKRENKMKNYFCKIRKKRNKNSLNLFMSYQIEIVLIISFNMKDNRKGFKKQSLTELITKKKIE